MDNVIGNAGFWGRSATFPISDSQRDRKASLACHRRHLERSVARRAGAHDQTIGLEPVVVARHGGDPNANRRRVLLVGILPLRIKRASLRCSSGERWPVVSGLSTSNSAAHPTGRSPASRGLRESTRLRAGLRHRPRCDQAAGQERGWALQGVLDGGAKALTTTH